jgi:hypothetical protein
MRRGAPNQMGTADPDLQSPGVPVSEPAQSGGGSFDADLLPPLGIPAAPAVSIRRGAPFNPRGPVDPDPPPLESGHPSPLDPGGRPGDPDLPSTRPGDKPCGRRGVRAKASELPMPILLLGDLAILLDIKPPIN